MAHVLEQKSTKKSVLGQSPQTPTQHVDTSILSSLKAHNRRLGLRRILKSVSYERAAELPPVIRLLEGRMARKQRVLDIGSGDSVLPTYLLSRTPWDIVCVDKFASVHVQRDYAEASASPEACNRLTVLHRDVLDYLPEEQFDIITSISVIEHFPDPLDIKAMALTGAMLKPGGIYVLTTPVNDGFPQDFYRGGKVYGDQTGEKTFFQRHYDLEGLQRRLIKPSGLAEVSRTYFGEYGFPFGEWFMFPPVKTHPWKLFYKWASPWFSQRFIEYRSTPMRRKNMYVDTAAGVILAMTRK
jgi:2-polyprenyl-3-methyl-5-hydroxy-6-metoxy-1,4-benzoquinol methylase